MYTKYVIKIVSFPTAAGDWKRLFKVYRKINFKRKPYRVIRTSKFLLGNLKVQYCNIYTKYLAQTASVIQIICIT